MPATSLAQVLMDLTDLYSDRIIEIAANQPRPGRLAAPQASARKVARVCGSVIEVDVSVQADVITGYGHELSACALGQTSAAIVAREIVGTPIAEFRRVRDEMVRMLKENGPPPAGVRWADLKWLEPVRAYRPRHASTLLVFDAVCEALDRIAADSAA